MLKHLFALSLFPAIFLFTSPAPGQSNPPQASIACEVKDNVEDGACQNKLEGLFTRKGDTLTLKLDGGKSKTYVGNRAACDGENVDVSKCLVFVVLKYFPRTQSYLIERGFYECGAYLFVSRRTGSETVMYVIPVLSPNAKYLLSIDQSDACDRKYDIAIWSMQTDPPKLEFKYEAKQYENWEVAAWENDTHIKMKALTARRPTIRRRRWLGTRAAGASTYAGRPIVRNRTVQASATCPVLARATSKTSAHVCSWPGGDITDVLTSVALGRSHAG
jgi:hypothetical protein